MRYAFEFAATTWGGRSRNARSLHFDARRLLPLLTAFDIDDSSQLESTNLHLLSQPHHLLSLL